MKYESETNRYILDKAVDKLNHFGMDIFEMFCNENDIAFCDRNRCIAKCKVAYGKTNVMEMSLPDSMKQERWEWYTIKLRYHPKKAKDLLDRIDESYKNQFTPNVRVATLAQGMLRSL